MRLKKAPFLFRQLLLLIALLGLSLPASSQSLFPIKKNKKWGLINAEGRIVKQPVYDAIGEFKQHGYAIMQRQGRVGLLNQEGTEIVPPRYNDVKVLDSTLITVMDEAEWKVINLQGQVVLSPGYERVEVLKGGASKSAYLAYLNDGKWGLIDGQGRVVAEQKFDKISLLENVPKHVKGLFFQTRNENLLGVLLPSGFELMSPQADEIRVYNDRLIFYKKDRRWGAVDQQGTAVLRPVYNFFSSLSKKFIRLTSDGNSHLFSLVYNKLVTSDKYEAFYPFSADYVLCKRNRKLGLIDHCGSLVLSTQYNEIQPYDGDTFRANLNGRWGIVTLDDQELIAFNFDYIAPMKQGLCVVIKNRQMGIANRRGQIVVAPGFDRILLEAERAKAYRGKKLTLFNFDKNGEIADESSFGKHFTIRVMRENDQQPVLWGDAESPYQLEKFEWFYSPKYDKWGLRRLDNGEVQIEPSFQSAFM